MPARFVRELTDTVIRTMRAHVPQASVVELSTAIWVVACSECPDTIDNLPFADDCPVPGPKCPTCQAGRDQARAYMREHPGKHIAIGLVTFDVF